MDKTVIALQELYGEMFNELRIEVEALDGTVDDFNPDEKIMAITVDPELQEYLEILLVDITTKYDKKKIAICSADPFYGVKVILGN